MSDIARCFRSLLFLSERIEFLSRSFPERTNEVCFFSGARNELGTDIDNSGARMGQLKKPGEAMGLWPERN